MQNYPLVPHPAHPPLELRTIQARVTGMDENWLRLRWRMEGVGKLVVPSFAGKGRSDELWRTTCFEAFLKPSGGAAYAEFNLSPSERWAAYDFARYREGMDQRSMPREPVCTMRLGQEMAIFDAAVPRAALPELPCDLALTAVIEEEGGQISYWAMAHGGEKPDFHDAACFGANLAPPDRV